MTKIVDQPGLEHRPRWPEESANVWDYLLLVLLLVLVSYLLTPG